MYGPHARAVAFACFTSFSSATSSGGRYVHALRDAIAQIDKLGVEKSSATAT
jgi:hypothetical protein